MIVAHIHTRVTSGLLRFSTSSLVLVYTHDYQSYQFGRVRTGHRLMTSFVINTFRYSATLTVSIDIDRDLGLSTSAFVSPCIGEKKIVFYLSAHV